MEIAIVLSLREVAGWQKGLSEVYQWCGSWMVKGKV